MSQLSSSEALGGSEFFEAVVQALDENRLCLRRADLGGKHVDARNAVHGYRPTVGDRVLCAGHGTDLYVTGVLMAPEPALRIGEAAATVEHGQFIVRDGDGEVLVRFDPASGETRVSAGAVLALEANERLELRAPDITLDAVRLTQRVDRLVTEANQVSTSAQRWDLRAGKITERASNVFRDVTDLLQTRVGTLRNIARGSMTLFAERTSIRSKKDTAIDGERVLLG